MAVVVVFGAAYGCFVYSLSERWGVRTFAGSVRVFGIGFLVSLAAGIPLHVRLQRLIDRWFESDGTAGFTLRKFLADLAIGGDIGRLVHRALQAVCLDLGLDRAALFVLSADQQEFVLTAACGAPPEQRGLATTHSLIEMLSLLHREITRWTLQAQARYANVRDAYLHALDRLGADLVFPIEVEGTVVGFLTCGVSHDVREPAAVDLELLRTLSAEIGVCIARDRDATRLRQVRLELERFTRYLPRTVARDVLRGVLPSERGRRRPVTVVACDIAGLGAFVEAESEELAGVLRAYHETVADEARREGGTLAHAHRGRVMAVFGDPEPHPDHARRALRMAVRAARRADEIWAIWRDRIPDLDVRIVAATAPAVVGFIPIGAMVSYELVGHLHGHTESLLERATHAVVLTTRETLAVAGDGVEAAPLEAGPVVEAATAYRLIAVSDAEPTS